MFKFAVIAFALFAGVSAQAVATASASAVGTSSASASATATASSTDAKPYYPKYPKYYPKKDPSPKPYYYGKKVEDPSPKPVVIKIVDDPKPVVGKKEKEDDVVVVIEGEGAAPAPVVECTTIAAAAVATPELSTLVAALTAAGLVETLSDPTLVATVLAPTNDAFEALFEAFEATPEQVLADPQLANILLYHVIGGVAAKAADLEDRLELTTLLGQDLTVRLRGDGVRFVGAGSRADVVVADVEACAAVIHVIDNVLLPDFEALTESAPVEAPAVEATAESTATVTLNV